MIKKNNITKIRLCGFTLIELMISISLSVLVVTLTVVNVSFLNKGIIRSEVDKLYAACMYMQQCALLSGKEQVITFNVHNNSYSFNGRTEKLLSPIIFGILPGVMGPPSTPIKKLKSSISFQENRIVFHADGMISSGTIYMIDHKKEYICALSNGIAQISHLRKYSYNGKWQLLP